MNSTAGPASLTALIETVHRLRAPGGCPWDRAQTHQSLRQYLIEEAHEVLDVLDLIESKEDLKKKEIRAPFQEELGDLLMQVLLHSEMTSEESAFTIYDVAQGLNDKLIRRHPHVFGEQKADSAESALSHWEKQKAKEKASNPSASVLDGVPKGLPALQRAARVIEKVTKVGFQWPDMTGPLAKIDEELAEFKAEVEALTAISADVSSDGLPEMRTEAPTEKRVKERESARKKAENELGDLFFTLANVAYLMKINPEDALRSQLKRFESRFKHVEKRLKEKGRTPDQSNLEEMDQYWNESKELEKASASPKN